MKCGVSRFIGAEAVDMYDGFTERPVGVFGRATWTGGLGVPRPKCLALRLFASADNEKETKKKETRLRSGQEDA